MSLNEYAELATYAYVKVGGRHPMRYMDAFFDAALEDPAPEELHTAICNADSGVQVMHAIAERLSVPLPLID